MGCTKMAPVILLFGVSLLTLACTAMSESSPQHLKDNAFYETSDSWGLPANHVQFGPAWNSTPFLGDTAAPVTPTVGLLVPLRSQEQGSWCALASVQMVASYYGLVASQCRLADLRDGYPEGTCCAAPTDTRCDHGTAFWPLIKVISALGLYGAASPGPLAEDELRDEILNGRPVILVEAATTFSHAVVAFGYDEGTADEPATFALNDPVSGFKQLSYTELRAQYWSGSSIASGTFYRLAPSPDGCNRGFDPTCGEP